MQVTLADLVPSLPDADIFICGPAAWARAVERDASDAGVPRHALHREEFGW
jgi:ferredoxin-NADP reductase